MKPSKKRIHRPAECRCRMCCQSPADRRSALLAMKQRLRRTARSRRLMPIRFKRFEEENSKSSYGVGDKTRHRIRTLKGRIFRAYYDFKLHRHVNLTWRESNISSKDEFFEFRDID